MSIFTAVTRNHGNGQKSRYTASITAITAIVNSWFSYSPGDSLWNRKQPASEHKPGTDGHVSYTQVVSIAAPFGVRRLRALHTRHFLTWMCGLLHSRDMRVWRKMISPLWNAQHCLTLTCGEWTVELCRGKKVYSCVSTSWRYLRKSSSLHQLICSNLWDCSDQTLGKYAEKTFYRLPLVTIRMTSSESNCWSMRSTLP